mgnify:CR=1 FL=1
MDLTLITKVGIEEYCKALATARQDTRTSGDDMMQLLYDLNVPAEVRVRLVQLTMKMERGLNGIDDVITNIILGRYA